MSAKDFRTNIGANIIREMEKADDLPLPNLRRVAKVMVEYFYREGHADIVARHKSNWVPDADYFASHMGDIQKRMRDSRNEFFEFVRGETGFTGEWKFVTKLEYEEILKRTYSEIGTRTDTFNGKLEDGQERWKLDVPKLADVPLLTDERKRSA